MTSQRLPIPGSDDGTWGAILNGYLQVAHDTNGNLLSAAVSSALPTPIPATNLGSGSASSSTYLRGDGTWAVPAGITLEAIGPPSSLNQGQLYYQLDSSGTYVVAEWLGTSTPSNPVKVLDTTDVATYGTLAARPLASAAGDKAFYTATDQTGNPVYQVQSGVWVQVAVTTSVTKAAVIATGLAPTDIGAAAAPTSVSTHFRSVGINPYTAAMTNSAGANYECVVPVQIITACTLTGLAFENGSAVSGNIKVTLRNASGVLLVQSASVAQTGTYAMQTVPFTSTQAVTAGLYYFGFITSSSASQVTLETAPGANVFSAPSLTPSSSITPPSISSTYQVPALVSY